MPSRISVAQCLSNANVLLMSLVVSDGKKTHLRTVYSIMMLGMDSGNVLLLLLNLTTTFVDLHLSLLMEKIKSEMQCHVLIGMCPFLIFFKYSVTHNTWTTKS